jgi:hypothetical protein
MRITPLCCPAALPVLLSLPACTARPELLRQAISARLHQRSKALKGQQPASCCQLLHHAAHGHSTEALIHLQQGRQSSSGPRSCRGLIAWMDALSSAHGTAIAWPGPCCCAALCGAGVHSHPWWWCAFTSVHSAASVCHLYPTRSTCMRLCCSPPQQFAACRTSSTQKQSPQARHTRDMCAELYHAGAVHAAPAPLWCGQDAATADQHG